MVKAWASGMHASHSMKLRLQVGRAAAFLAVARFLVRFVPLRIWRSSLGSIYGNSADGVSPVQPEADSPSCDLVVLRHALMIGRCVERAAEILPGHSRCLPKAVALQWILRRGKIVSRLVIAFKVEDRSSADAYHAWVERDGEMLVGHCDRASYRTILTFVHSVTSGPGT